jgi:hypothetical protein
MRYGELATGATVCADFDAGFVTRRFPNGAT